MGEYRKTIEERYEFYIDEYPEKSVIVVQDWDYPLQGGVLSDNINQISISNTVGELEPSCLIEYRSDIPNVENLPQDDLKWLPVGLTQILKIQRTPDHDAVWTLTGKMLSRLNSNGDPFEVSLVRNVETLIRSVLCSSWVSSSEIDDEWTESANKAYVIGEASILARYMAYPTIEGMVKCLCRRDLKMNGDVRSGRQVRAYGRDDYQYGDQVSNIGHLLWHLEQDVVENRLQTYLKQFREAIADFFKLEDKPYGAYGYLHRQRNNALHGEMRARAEFGILLNLISLIILNIDHIPEERRKISTDD